MDNTVKNVLQEQLFAAKMLYLLAENAYENLIDTIYEYFGPVNLDDLATTAPDSDNLDDVITRYVTNKEYDIDLIVRDLADYWDKITLPFA